MTRILSTATVGLFVSTLAVAADGYLTGNVNLRAGPDRGYPSVAMLSIGTRVAIEGCVDGWSWCDVAAGNDRGWVAGNFLQEDYHGQRVLVPAYGVQIGIPIVSFVFGTYWDDHYRNRSWYGNRQHWSQIRPQYQPMAVRDGAPRPADESRRSAVATVRPSQKSRSSNTVVRQQVAATKAVATKAGAPENDRSRTKPMEHNPGVSRLAMAKPAQPKAKTVEPKAQQDEKTSAKAAPGREASKDQH